MEKLKSGNIRHEDGRIFQHGDGVSVTVSPYAPDFIDNIEDDIRPLVQAFMAKGYLPYSSCAGHTYKKRRFVALAFHSAHSAHIFKDMFEHFKNYEWGHILDVKVKDPVEDYEHDSEMDYDTQTNYLNHLYMRGYDEYYMVEISIGLNSHEDKQLTLDKATWRDQATKQIENYVNRELPHYAM